MKMSTEYLYEDEDLFESQLETLAKWLSCNGEIWGIGPTAVFASAAALFLYRQLESTIFVAGDHFHVTVLEKTLVSTMVLGMLALMIHLWVCSMRFFQYYLDTLIKDSPSVLLEMTTAGLLGAESELVPLGPLTRFLKQQQPQIHITVCWFLSLCYADYVRKNYCQRFNLPYLEQCWAKCGESVLSMIPTMLWAVGAAALAHRLLSALFRRFLFRRVPLWELILQHLLFLWMVIYSLHFWVLLVRVIKFMVDYVHDDSIVPKEPSVEDDNHSVIQQWIIWMFGAMPLAYYIISRPRPEHPPLMIWITTSPWHRREMGPYGYYLNRPLTSLHSSTNVAGAHQALTARRAFSDSKIIKEPIKKKRHSKSV